MKKTVIKAALAVVLILTMVFSLASCGGTSAKVKDAESASGSIANTPITWNYDANTKTLSVNGSGAMPDFENQESVPWYAVRHSAEKVVISEGITNIGKYAFYYFPAMTSVAIPASVTSLGDFSFAFCSSLAGFSVSDTVTSLGNSCFEACSSLSSVFVPATVTSIGEKAFAYCGALKSAIVMAHVTDIKAGTFKNCKSLETLAFSATVANATVAADAFDGASKSFASAEFLASDTGEATLTIKYVYEDGTEAAPTYTANLSLGGAYSVNSPVIDAFTASELTISGTIAKDTERIVKYTQTPVETEPVETAEEMETTVADEDKGINVGTIIAIVIFAIVIIGIVVFAVFMVRSDKKAQASAGKPVVKNNKNDKSGKNKKGGKN